MSSFRKSIKGKFTPKNPQKYVGNANNIIYRSLLERRFMVKFDESPNIIKWGSEEVVVEYADPFQKGKIRRYFPDFVIQQKDKEGNLKVWMIEIKPAYQTEPPKNDKNKRLLAEWVINNSKWEHAVKYCEKRNWTFVVLTEKNL